MNQAFTAFDQFYMAHMTCQDRPNSDYQASIVILYLSASAIHATIIINALK